MQLYVINLSLLGEYHPSSVELHGLSGYGNARFLSLSNLVTGYYRQIKKAILIGPYSTTSAQLFSWVLAVRGYVTQCY
jgi:hypothetical protein